MQPVGLGGRFRMCCTVHHVLTEVAVLIEVAGHQFPVVMCWCLLRVGEQVVCSEFTGGVCLMRNLPEKMHHI